MTEANSARQTDADLTREARQRLDESGTDRILRQREVLAMLGISRPTLWEWRRRGIFPEPALLGPARLLGWWRSAVYKWVEDQKRGGAA
jgi:predicted DNA-binding transcriptional regulator AlpA